MPDHKFVNMPADRELIIIITLEITDPNLELFCVT